MALFEIAAFLVMLAAFWFGVALNAAARAEARRAAAERAAVIRFCDEINNLTDAVREAVALIEYGAHFEARTLIDDAIDRFNDARERLL